MTKTTKHARNGYAIVLSILLSIFLLGSLVSLASIRHATEVRQRSTVYREVAHRSAETGIERAIERVTANRSLRTSGWVSSESSTCGWSSGLSGVHESCGYRYCIADSGPNRIMLKSEGELKINGTTVAQRGIQTVVTFASDYRLIHLTWDEFVDFDNPTMGGC